MAGAAIAMFLGSTALVEKSELATVYAATAGRFVVVCCLVLFT